MEERHSTGGSDYRPVVYQFRDFLLENLPEESRQKLLENVSFTTYPAGRYVFREGEPADHIVVITQGMVKLFHTDADGHENIVMLLSENDTIWENLFLYEGTFPYSAITLTKTRLCRIYRENFLHILDNPAASLQIVSMLSRKLHDANQRVQVLSTQDPSARIAGFLLMLLERHPDGLLVLRLEDIASSIGLRMETISRKLGQMQTEGLVQREGKGRLRIKNAEALRRIYQDEEE